MKKKQTQYRFMFAGGGTGGHLFPAIAVADKIKVLLPEAEILFIGTRSRIEGKVVPKLGYKFKSIWIKGFSRKLNLENLLFPVKLLVSTMQSYFINLKFKPAVAIGSGGYVSGPAVFGASKTGAKVILLEQNSYPGVTTRLLEKYAVEVHLSFEDSKKYFKDKTKLFVTGNPVRENLSTVNKNDALKKYELASSKKTLLILGGSLGAYSLNEAIAKSIKRFEEKDLQIIWQTGSNYYDNYKNLTSKNIKVMAFIEEMNLAYSACDILLARAGATTIAELLALGIPAILVPSPNVAENHQYFNAKSLADKKAAILIEDKNLNEELENGIYSLLNDDILLAELKKNALSIGKPDAAEIIAKNAIKYAQSI